MREGRWERAVRVAIDVGSYKRKARLRRQVEKGVLQVRAARKKAAYAAAKTKRDNRPKLDAEDRPKYRKRMLKLRKEGVKYGQAAFIIETEFRKKKRDRHHAKRIRELAPNPIPLKDSIPPKDYVR